MERSDIENKIKNIIIDSLNLEDLTVENIDTQAALFDENGVGLDSIDALELGVQIGRQFGIKLSGNSAENKEHFYSVQTLTLFVESQLLKGNS